MRNLCKAGSNTPRQLLHCPFRCTDICLPPRAGKVDHEGRMRGEPTCFGRFNRTIDESPSQVPDEEVIDLSAVIHDVPEIPIAVFLVQPEEGRRDIGPLITE